MARKPRSRPKTKPPNSTAKLALEIIEDHARHPHPNLDGQALKVHLLLHQIVEKQLFEHQPPEASAALATLLEQGWERHQAIHALARAVARFAIGQMRAAQAPDLEKYRSELTELVKHPPKKAPDASS
ncbi:MAG: DUF1841 family protein [Myxococcales bacterium]|nr:DUF1841 family protein [Myxococcales bacterium]